MKYQLTRFLSLLGAAVFFMLGLSTLARAIPAPELDPSTAGSGVALLVGGALLLIERYRRNR